MPRTKTVVLEDEDLETPERELPEEEEEEEVIVEDENLGRITSITYKTNKNLGNSEHETVELTYSVNEGEDHDEAFAYVKGKALEYLGIDV